MKERSYFEVLKEIERDRDKCNKYERFDVQLLLGSICAKLVEQVEKDEKVESINAAQGATKESGTFASRARTIEAATSGQAGLV